MAHKKGVGSSRNGRDSGPKYLGVDTLFTVVDGQVRFEHKNKKRYQVSVYPKG